MRTRARARARIRTRTPTRCLVTRKRRTSECDDRGRGGAWGGHRGASGVPAGPFYYVLPISGHTSSLVWCGPFRPRIIPRPEGGERGDNERGDKVETWMFLL